MTKYHRFLIAEEIIRRVDTVTLVKVEEVRDIRQRAESGEYDDWWTVSGGIAEPR